MGEEKRKFPRSKCFLPAEVLRIKGKNRLIERSSIRNFSPEGAKLVMNFNLTPGSDMEIKLSLPEKNLSVSLSAEIVWIKQKDNKIEAGLKIKEMDQKLKEEILDWLSPKWSGKNSDKEEKKKKV